MTICEVDRFGTDDDFKRTEQSISALISSGELKPMGLDPSDPFHLVHRFLDNNGAMWHLAMPDQAFRGYLRKVVCALQVSQHPSCAKTSSADFSEEKSPLEKQSKPTHE